LLSLDNRMLPLEPSINVIVHAGAAHTRVLPEAHQRDTPALPRLLLPTHVCNSEREDQPPGVARSKGTWTFPPLQHKPLIGCHAKARHLRWRLFLIAASGEGARGDGFIGRFLPAHGRRESRQAQWYVDQRLPGTSRCCC
jgi:hypothetical protein